MIRRQDFCSGITLLVNRIYVTNLVWKFFSVKKAAVSQKATVVSVLHSSRRKENYFRVKDAALSSLDATFVKAMLASTIRIQVSMRIFSRRLFCSYSFFSLFYFIPQILISIREFLLNCFLCLIRVLFAVPWIRSFFCLHSCLLFLSTFFTLIPRILLSFSCPSNNLIDTDVPARLEQRQFPTTSFAWEPKAS